MSLNTNRMITLAADHVQWFSEILKPLLRSWMEHGYKHGWKDRDRITELPRILFVVILSDTAATLAVCSTQKRADAVVSSYKKGVTAVCKWELDGPCQDCIGEKRCSD